MTGGRMTGALLALLAALAGVLVLPTAPASAAEGGYRFWSFWERDGSAWAYATQGPATARPADGDVLGFRFSLSEDSGDAAKPRGATDFAALCEGTPEKAGTQRVGLVLDYGTGADAADGESPPRPRTTCARIADDGTAADALADAAKPLRYDSAARLCALDGYPEKGCGEQVTDSGGGEDSAPPADTQASGDNGSDGGGTAVGVAVGAGAVVVLAGAAFVRSRRRGED